MKMIEILVIGNYPEILETVLRLVNKNPQWNGTGVSTVQAACDVCSQKTFDLALIGGGLSEAEEKELEETLSTRYKNIKLVRHYGGGSGLLTTEILQALDDSASV